MKKVLFVLLVSATLGACSFLGVVPAQSLSQQVAYGYGTVAGVRTAAANALTSGAISPTVAQTVLATTDTARASLDAAEMVIALSGQDDPQGDAVKDLNIATQLLQAAQAALPKVGAVPVAASAPVAASQ